MNIFRRVRKLITGLILAVFLGLIKLAATLLYTTALIFEVFALLIYGGKASQFIMNSLGGTAAHWMLKLEEIEVAFLQYHVFRNFKYITALGYIKVIKQPVVQEWPEGVPLPKPISPAEWN